MTTQPTMNQYRIGFILEQALGHITHTRNLQALVPSDRTVEPYWAPVPWEVSGWAARMPLYKSNWTVRAGLRARRLLRRLDRQVALDVLLFHTQVPAILATDWVRHIPTIVSLDATPLQYDELGASYDHRAGPGWLERLKWRLNRDCFGAARKLVTWSHWAKQGLVKDYETDATKVAVIPPGVDVRAWAPPGQRDDGRKTVNILFVGGNLERKGGRLLLEAFRALKPLDVELHLVTRDGMDPEPGLFVYNQLQPNSDTLKQLYWHSDIFCLPTSGDCLPMVLSEAGAAGLPLVSTQVAAIPEIVRDGETGLLVPKGDVLALTAALRRLIDDVALRRQLGACAAERVAKDYDAAHNTTRLLDLLKEVADEGSGSRSVRGGV